MRMGVTPRGSSCGGSGAKLVPVKTPTLPLPDRSGSGDCVPESGSHAPSAPGLRVPARRPAASAAISPAERTVLQIAQSAIRQFVKSESVPLMLSPPRDVTSVPQVMVAPPGPCVPSLTPLINVDSRADAPDTQVVITLYQVPATSVAEPGFTTKPSAAKK